MRHYDTLTKKQKTVRWVMVIAAIIAVFIVIYSLMSGFVQITGWYWLWGGERVTP